MEKKEAIKALASVSTVIAATALTPVANANQQEVQKWKLILQVLK